MTKCCKTRYLRRRLLQALVDGSGVPANRWSPHRRTLTVRRHHLHRILVLPIPMPTSSSSVNAITTPPTPPTVKAPQKTVRRRRSSLTLQASPLLNHAIKSPLRSANSTLQFQRYLRSSPTRERSTSFDWANHHPSETSGAGCGDGHGYGFEFGFRRRRVEFGGQ
jgi:hypothetical protein